MLTASEITRLLDVANAGVQRGEVALARKVYQGILAGHPDHVPTLVSLAMSHIAVGPYEEADGILGKVLESHPEDPDALAYLGLSAFLAGRKDEARGIFEQVPKGTHAKAMADALAAEC